MRAVNKEFYGKIFLAPPTGNVPVQHTELWINFGWNTKGNQLFPEYQLFLAPVCSNERYDALMREIKAYLDANGIDLCCVNCTVACCMAGCPCIVWPCFWALKCQADKITAKLSELVDDAKIGGPVPPRLQLVQATSPGADVPSHKAYDHFGQPCMGRFETSGKQVSTYSAPTWPPRGYSIIVTVPGTELRAAWPRADVIPVAAAAPAVITAPAPTCVVMAEATPLPATMDREKTPAERVQEVQTLKDQGLISEEEFAAKKQEILNAI